jgi:hypothetical protein
MLATQVRSSGRGRRRVRRRRGRRRRVVARLVPQRRLRRDLLDQTLNPPGIKEGWRRLRLGILVVDLPGHADQASDLILFRLRLMHPRSTTGLPRVQTAAVHLDDRQWRRGRHGRLQLASPALLDLLIALGGQFGTDEVGQTRDMAGMAAWAADRSCPAAATIFCSRAGL